MDRSILAFANSALVVANFSVNVKSLLIESIKILTLSAPPYLLNFSSLYEADFLKASVIDFSVAINIGPESLINFFSSLIS